MRKPILIFSALALAVALSIIGCGGSDATLSKAEFIKQGDVICKKADDAELREYEKYVRANRASLSRLSPEAYREKLIVDLALPSTMKETEKLEALGIPSGDEEKVEAIFSGIREAIKKSEEESTRAEENLPNGSSNPSYVFNDVNRLARAYGFKQCNEVI
jgi:hypothetical protein